MCVCFLCSGRCTDGFIAAASGLLVLDPMELQSEVMVEDGDVELSLGLSLGGRCNKGVVPLNGILNQRSGYGGGGGDPNPVVQANASRAVEKEKEGGEQMDSVRKREKLNRHDDDDDDDDDDDHNNNNNNNNNKKKKKKKQQGVDNNKRQKVLKETEADRTNNATTSPMPNPSPNPGPNPNPSPNQSPDPKANVISNLLSPPNTTNSDHTLAPYGTLPVVPMQYPYHPPPQCLPFGFPYMVPWWSLPVSSGPDGFTNQGRNVFQPVPSRSFIPFHGPAANGRKDTNGAINRLPSLTASQGSSFSAISDFHTGSHQGGGSSSSSSSSDTRSNTNQAVEEKSQPNSPTTLSELQQHSPSYISRNQIQALDKVDAESTDNALIPNSTKSIPGPTLVTKAAPELNSVKHEGTTTTPVKNHVPAGDHAKPIVPPLTEMPCVSTTGDGPNGKKITGFLYRYNKNEVSIVCVCHGSSFSPAEFIKHAGGSKVLHPLRHIVIVPS